MPSQPTKGRNSHSSKDERASKISSGVAKKPARSIKPIIRRLSVLHAADQAASRPKTIISPSALPAPSALSSLPVADMDPVSPVPESTTSPADAISSPVNTITSLPDPVSPPVDALAAPPDDALTSASDETLALPPADTASSRTVDAQTSAPADILPPLPVGTPAGPAASTAASPTAEVLSSPTGEASTTPAGRGQDDETIDVWTDSNEQGRLQITGLIVKLQKKTKFGPGSVSDDELNRRLRSVRAFLWHLQFQVAPSPRLKQSPLRLDEALKLLFEKNRDLVPNDIARDAATIYTMFERDNWGADATDDGDAQAGSDEELPPPAPSVAGPASAGLAPAGPSPAGSAPAGPVSASSAGPALPGSGGGTSIVRLPPTNHPIWGVNGAMHGLIMIRRPNGKTTYRFDPRYIGQKRDAKVFGHNGLNPGDWWPIRHVALFHGAHGAKMRGICGTPSLGTYSIVVSGKSTPYDDLDQDFGDTIYYSADSSHTNLNPTTILTPTPDTLSLRRSLATGAPVRVLRSAAARANHRAYAPSVGIRYDGLYRVIAEQQAHNARGGLYYKYTLRREPGQRSLAGICAAVPGAGERDVAARFREGY